MSTEQLQAQKTFRSFEEFRITYFPDQETQLSSKTNREESYGVRLAQTMLAKHAGMLNGQED